jgi:hypothetical protein
MDTIFFWCAIVGGTILVCQFLLTLFGMGDGGADLDAGTPEFGHAADAGGAGHDVGGGHDIGTGHDVASDAVDQHNLHDSTGLFKIITFRTLVAAVAFFGITGMAARDSGLELPATLVLSLGAGAAAMYGVYYLMNSLTRFDFDGNLRIERAIDKTGTVYVPIAANNQGAGKIHLQLQNQLVEFQAVTAGERLATGATVVVTRVVGPDTVEVALLNPAEIPSHV